MTSSKPNLPQCPHVAHSFHYVLVGNKYPNQPGVSCNGISSSDSDNYLGFLPELRSQPAAKNLYLTATVSTFPFAGSDGQPMAGVSQFAEVLDHIAIMNYDINVRTSHISHQQHI